ncbi:MAG: M60 family metallopeptidase [Cellulophaga sp.]
MIKIRIQYFTFLFGFLFLLIGCSKDDDSSGEDEQGKLKPSEESYSFIVEETYLNHNEASRLGRNMGLASFEPTGLYVDSGIQLEVAVEQKKGQDLPTLLIGTYSRYKWTWSPKEVALRLGRNVITNRTGKDAFIYIDYGGEELDSEVKVTIKGARKAAYFELNKTNMNTFRTALEENSFRDAMLKSNKTMVVARRAILKKYKSQDWNALLETLDKIVDAEKDIDGLDSSSEVHIPNRNRYLLTESEDSDYWMAATWNRTFYNQENAIDFVVDNVKLTTEGWGPWHELGHQHQQTNITWPAVGEVTVNVYSLAAQRALGQTSRLAGSDLWNEVATYMELPIETRDFNESSLGAFFKLCMYQQLWLHYGDAIFIGIHRKVREEALSLTSVEDKMGYFMKIASEVSGNNLTDFFKNWGFNINDSYFNAVEALDLPNPTVDITTLTE